MDYDVQAIFPRAAISSHFYPDTDTHITQNRFPRGYTFMKFLTGLLVDHENPKIRALKTLSTIFRRPSALDRHWRAKNWHQRVTFLTVMQHLDNRIVFNYDRKASAFFRCGLKSARVKGQSAPAYLPVANPAARTLAAASGGDPANILKDSKSL